MTMSHDGLTKLIEECGEVIQVAAKLQAYPSGNHPDGNGHLYDRLEDELADLIAAIAFVADTFKLNGERMMERGDKKRKQFQEWHDDKQA